MWMRACRPSKGLTTMRRACMPTGRASHSPDCVPPPTCRFNDPNSPLRVCFIIKQLAVGINLIGANHLILLEPAYNPAKDKQAMERIHRDGELAYHHLLSRLRARLPPPAL